MSAYRDNRECCPRCATELIDARAARGCPTCRGLWLAMPDLSTMATDMQRQSFHLELPFVPHERQALPCPNCREAMGTWSLFDVHVDRCDPHGVWFDPDELAQVLLAVWVRSSSV